MLKRTKKDDNSTPFTADNILQEKAASPSPTPTLRPSISNEDKITSQQKTTIGQQITIEGNIRGEENLTINGTMKGNIEMGKHNFAIGPKGRVDGEIHARDVSIDGQFKGTIKALGKVAVSKEADFNGEIKARSFSVEDGAYFKGVVELDREPPKRSAVADVPGRSISSEIGKQSVTSPTDEKMEK